MTTVTCLNCVESERKSDVNVTTPTVASLLPGLTDIIIELGCSNLVVAASHECESSSIPVTSPKLPVSGNLDISVSSLEISAGWNAISANLDTRHGFDFDVSRLICSFYTVDIEKLAKTKPSVLLTILPKPSTPLCPSEADILDAIKYSTPTIKTILSLDPCSLSEIIAAVQSVSSALHCLVSGSRIVSELQNRLEIVRCFAKLHCYSNQLGSTCRRRVGIVQWADPVYLAGGWVPEIVLLAGGSTDNYTRPGGPSVTVKPEGLLEFEIVVFAICAVDLTNCQRVIRTFLQKQASILPIIMPRIVATNSTKLFSRPSPLTVAQSAEVVAEIISNTDQFGHHGKVWVNVDPHSKL